MTASQPAAFGSFYSRYEQAVLAYFLRRTSDADVSADLTAEVFARVLQGASTFSPRRAGGEVAAGWLFAIAHNTLMSSLRRGRVAAEARVKLGMREPLVLTDDALERVDELAAPHVDLDEHLAALRPEQRAAVWARVVEERSYRDIAADLRCSELVVRKRVSRGLERLRTSIEEGA